MLDQFIRVRRPIDFDLRHKMRKRVCLNTNGRNAQFFAFNNGCAGAAERIEDTMARVDAKTFKVLANHMWRKGQHEAIPVVCGAILIVYLVDIAPVSVMTAFVQICPSMWSAALRCASCCGSFKSATLVISDVV
jgi:hypothetical protein